MAFGSGHGLPEGFPQPRIISGVGEGWWPIIQDLHQELLSIDPNYHLDQVKEKFGTLNYYISYDVHLTEGQKDALNYSIGQAQQLSAVTCEVCGEPGHRVNPDGWIHTLCEEHEKKYVAGWRPWRDDEEQSE